MSIVSEKQVKTPLVVARQSKGRKGKRGNTQINQFIMPTMVNEHSAIDYKFVTVTAFNAASVTSTGTVSLLTSISQGSGTSNRVGDEIALKALEVSLGAYSNSGDVVGGVMRVIIFRWNLSSSVAAPTVANILEISSGATAPFSPLNMTGIRQEDFQILLDKLIGFNSANSASSLPYREKQILPNPTLRYDVAATTGQGHLYALAITDHAATYPTLTMVTRVLYSDS